MGGQIYMELGLQGIVGLLYKHMSKVSRVESDDVKMGYYQRVYCELSGVLDRMVMNEKDS